MRVAHHRSLLAFAVVAVGCSSAPAASAPDADATDALAPIFDTSVSADAAPPAPDAAVSADAAPPAPDAAVSADAAPPAPDAALPDAADVGAPPSREVCACVACSGHGTCVPSAAAPSCVCDPGYVASGLACTRAATTGGTTLYVSPTGNDASTGLAPSSALKTVAKALGKSKPGDVIFLEAGAAFAEAIVVPTGFGGSAGNPITITSDPKARARLTVPAGKHGVTIYDSSHLTLENLVLVGPGAAATTKDGVAAMSDARHQGLAFRNLEISGFYRGLFVSSWGGDKGFSDVLIDGVVSHDNRDAGISTYADVVGGHKNVTVRRSVAYGNLGDPAVKRPSGDGIVLGGVADALIERCVAHDNGGSGTNSAGPVGIWAYNAQRVTIQHNESYANHALLQDGDGFDLDVGVTDSVLQYNYSHDNDGAGLILCQTGAVPWNNNVVRYNVTINDARKQKMGSITWCSFGGGAGMKNSFVYGNTVVNAYGPALNPAMEAGSTGHVVFNNVFVTSNGKPLIWVWGTGKTAGLMTFAGNLYWTTGGAPTFEGSTSLDAWRKATGQELVSGKATGLWADPLLSTYEPACATAGGTPASPLAPLRLSPTSPAIDAGLAPSLFVTATGGKDFWGTPTPQGSGWDLGAEERIP
jgi:hypothetical protein